jgi:hypothetical protein
MLWPGTLIGAGAGFAIASIPGAMLGALLGQALDRRLHLQSWGHLLEKLGGRPALRNDELLFVLLGRLAKSDGQVVDGHIQQARQEMRALEMNESAQRRAIAAFNRGKSGNDRLRGYLRRLSAQPHAAEGVLRACWRMVWADGRAGTRERELIAQWGGGWAGGRIRCRRWRRTMSRKSDRWRTKQPPIKTPCGCWACQPPPSRRRSSVPIAACSVVIIRTKSPEGGDGTSGPRSDRENS